MSRQSQSTVHDGDRTTCGCWVVVLDPSNSFSGAAPKDYAITEGGTVCCTWKVKYEMAV